MFGIMSSVGSYAAKKTYKGAKKMLTGKKKGKITASSRGTSNATASFGQMIPEGRNVDIVKTADYEEYIDEDGNVDIRKKRCRRRRRRRLLTASDKADIAFVVGQLGTGQMGRSAVSALLSRRV